MHDYGREVVLASISVSDAFTIFQGKALVRRMQQPVVLASGSSF